MSVSAEQRERFVDRLAECAQGGNEVAFEGLARLLAPVIRQEARRFYHVPGADRDDVLQEALLALYLAVRAWDPQQPFEPFARLVMRRRLGSVLKMALAGKHRLLAGPRLEQPVRVAGVEAPLGEVIPSREAGPHERLEQREQLQRLAAAARRLTELERRAVGGTISGVPYAQLGNPKSIDNALQRARRRLREACA
jgi:RNA polymerase sporulation-specific sigma factor